MRADYQVVLDANVLANFSVCDVLLHLAETPRMYFPRWSDEILRETERTHQNQLHWPVQLAKSFQQEIRNSFPESLVEGYEVLIPACQNAPKDRHVLACAAYVRAELILTFNLRDFPPASLTQWNIEARHPQDYLLVLYAMEPQLVLHKLETLARKRKKALEDHLLQLGRFLPGFVHQVLEDLS